MYIVYTFCTFAKWLLPTNEDLNFNTQLSIKNQIWYMSITTVLQGTDVGESQCITVQRIWVHFEFEASLAHRASFRTGSKATQRNPKEKKTLKNSKILVSRQNLSLPLLLYVCTLECICVCVLCIHVYVCVLCTHVCVSCAYTYVCSMHKCVHTFSEPSMHRDRKRRLGVLIYHSTPDSAETASFSELGARLDICRS